MLAEWIIRINNPEILDQSTLLRIKKAQRDLCSPKPIWFLDPDLLEISKFKHNLNTKILKLAKDLDIEIKSEHRFEDWWLCQDSERNSRIIIELLREHGKTKNWEKLKNIGLRHIEQLL